MGKNKKPKSIGRLLIDLTPLLDVIFIVLNRNMLRLNRSRVRQSRNNLRPNRK